jgi:hypothetical protein
MKNILTLYFTEPSVTLTLGSRKKLLRIWIYFLRGVLAIEKLPSLFSVLHTEESMIMLEHYEHFRKLSQNIRNTSKLTSHADKFIFSSKNGTRLWVILLKWYNANRKTALGSLGRVMAWKGVEILRGQFQRTHKLWILIQNFWVKD